MMKGLLFTSAFALAIAISPAKAALQVVLDVDGITDTIADNSGSDSNPALNTIAVDDIVIDGVTFNGIARFVTTPSDQVQVQGLTFDNDTDHIRLASFTASDAGPPILSLGVDATVPAFGTVSDIGLEDVSGVPEPTTWAMLGIGFAFLGWAASRKAKQRFAF
jgi:hypothetical protein